MVDVKEDPTYVTIKYSHKIYQGLSDRLGLLQRKCGLQAIGHDESQMFGIWSIDPTKDQVRSFHHQVSCISHEPDCTRVRFSAFGDDTCEYCGAKLESGDTRCPDCGKRLEWAS